MGKVIWTKHLSERIRQRGLNPDWVDTAVRFPDEIQNSTTTNSKKYIKTINGYKIVAAVKRQNSDWIITSAWWKPAYGQSNASQQNKSLLERLVYRFVVFLEGLITGRK